MLVSDQSKSTLDHSPKADNCATWTLLRNLLLNISKATEATAKILKFWPGTFSSTCSLWSSQPCFNHCLSQEPINLIAQLSPRKILRFTSPGIGCLQGLSKRNQQFVAGFFRPPDKVIRAFRRNVARPSGIGGSVLLEDQQGPNWVCLSGDFRVGRHHALSCSTSRAKRSGTLPGKKSRIIADSTLVRSDQPKE